MHVTVAYHETFSEVQDRLQAWDRLFADNADLVLRARSGRDVRKARATGRTAVFFGLQNPGPVESDLGRIASLHRMGVRFMQITYNLQSLMGAGWQETEDSGVTRFGANAIAEMNRLGMIVDLSHAGARTAREAIDVSTRPVAVTHANPRWWRETDRNVPDDVIRALTAQGGMLGFSLYPHHLADGSACTLENLCSMIARVAETVGPEHLGFGSDLCQGQPDTIVQWMRDGRWTYQTSDAVFPGMPEWFQTNRDWDRIAVGLGRTGFSDVEVAGIMGENWLAFWEEGMQPALA